MIRPTSLPIRRERRGRVRELPWLLSNCGCSPDSVAPTRRSSLAWACWADYANLAEAANPSVALIGHRQPAPALMAPRANRPAAFRLGCQPPTPPRPLPSRLPESPVACLASGSADHRGRCWPLPLLPNVFDAQPPAPLGAPVGCCVVLGAAPTVSRKRDLHHAMPTAEHARLMGAQIGLTAVEAAIEHVETRNTTGSDLARLVLTKPQTMMG